jgi:FkbM family methyltransferase
LIYTPERNGIRAVFELDPSEECIVREIWTENVYQVVPQRGMRVLDIGANKGVFSVYAALHGAEVVAYEPHPKTYVGLLRNALLNGVETKVKPKHCGIWTSNGKATLYEDAACSGGTSMFDATAQRAAVEIDVVTLESALNAQPWDIVKLDAEGIEFDVIAQTSEDALSRIKYFTIEVHNTIGTQAQYNAMLAKLERVFHISGVYEITRRLNYIYASRR